MREIVLVFEGHEDSEKKAADIIQEAIFKALSQERMSIRQFTNQQAARKRTNVSPLQDNRILKFRFSFRKKVTQERYNIIDFVQRVPPSPLRAPS